MKFGFNWAGWVTKLGMFQLLKWSQMGTVAELAKTFLVKFWIKRKNRQESHLVCFKYFVIDFISCRIFLRCVCVCFFPFCLWEQSAMPGNLEMAVEGCYICGLIPLGVFLQL